MAVDAIRTKGDDCLRSVRPDFASDPKRDPIDRGADKGAGMCGLRRTFHPRIAITEEPDVGKAKVRHGVAQLLLPDGAKLIRIEAGDRTLASFSARGGDEHDWYIALPGSGDQAASREGLGVWMRKNRQKWSAQMNSPALTRIDSKRD